MQVPDWSVYVNALLKQYGLSPNYAGSAPVTNVVPQLPNFGDPNSPYFDPTHAEKVAWANELAGIRDASDDFRNRALTKLGIAGAAGLAGGALAGGFGGGAGATSQTFAAAPEITGVLSSGTSFAPGWASQLVPGGGVLASGGTVGNAALGFGGLGGGAAAAGPSGLGALLARGAASGAASSALGSGLMGKSGDSSSGNAASIQADIAQRLLQQTDPLRAALINRSTQFVGGGMDVSASPVFRALKGQTEAQFANARNNIIGGTPAGGQLVSALTDLEGTRARALGEGAGAVADSEMSRAFGLATGQTGQAVSGLGQAASLQAMLAQSEADREAGMLGALGAGAGAYFGSKA